MGKREIESAVYIALGGSGAAAMIGATALPEPSPYFWPLMALGLLLLLVAAVGIFRLWRISQKEADMADDKKSIVGWDIRNSSSLHPAAKVETSGSDPSAVGADVNVTAVPGYNTTGVRIVKDGSSKGPGLVIVQNGAGTGMRITMKPPSQPKD